MYDENSIKIASEILGKSFKKINDNVTKSNQDNRKQDSLFLYKFVADTLDALYKILFQNLFHTVDLRTNGGIVDMGIFPDIMPEHIKIDYLVDVRGKKLYDLRLFVCKRLFFIVKEQSFLLQVVTVHLAYIDDAFGSDIRHFEQPLYM